MVDDLALIPCRGWRLVVVSKSNEGVVMSRIEFSFTDKSEGATGKQLDFAMGWDRPFQSGWIYVSAVDVDFKHCDSKFRSRDTWSNSDALFAWLICQVRRFQPELVIEVARALESQAGVAAQKELEQHLRQGCRCSNPYPGDRCSNCGGVCYLLTNIEDDGNSVCWSESSDIATV